MHTVTIESLLLGKFKTVGKYETGHQKKKKSGMINFDDHSVAFVKHLENQTNDC